MTIELTPKEFRIVELVAQGMGRAQIAATLFNSVKTIDGQIQVIYQKLAQHGYNPSATMLAVLFIRQPELFIGHRGKQRNSTKKYFAMKMLRQRMHYRLVADRLEMKPTSTAMYKGKIPPSDFCSMPYLRLIPRIPRSQ
jgi:DNA-binding CsgD family transcriptional regulator